MLTFSKQLAEFSLYFLFCIAFAVLIFAINPKKAKLKNFLLFIIALSFILWGCKYFFHTSSFWSAKFLYSLLFFLVCKFTLKTSDIESLIYTILCSMLVYITDISNMLIHFSNKILCYFLLFVIIETLFYKILVKLSLISFCNNINDHLFDSDSIYFLLILAVLSFNVFEIKNMILANCILCIQVLAISLIFYLLKKELVIRKLETDIETLNNENDTLKGLLDNIRIFKHDYSNTLCSIGGYISLNDMEGLKNFYSKLSLDLNNVSNVQKINITSINEPSIYNLLVTKNKIIIAKHLKFDFYSDINYKNLSISPYELSKILGIFIDNAIDAATISPEKEISIVCKNVKNQFSQITIKNSYLNKDVNIAEMFSKGYSSKHIKSGLGLWEASKIIDSIPTVSLETKKDDDYFMQRLILNYKTSNNANLIKEELK